MNDVSRNELCLLLTSRDEHTLKRMRRANARAALDALDAVREKCVTANVAITIFGARSRLKYFSCRETSDIKATPTIHRVSDDEIVA